METRDIYLNLSPLDHRYYSSNKELFKKLSAFLSEKAAVRYQAEVELALLKTHLHYLYGPDKAADFCIETYLQKIDPEEIETEEQKTQHNIRALVNVLKKKVPEKYHHLLHLGATSVDILDTSYAMRIRNAVRTVILPLLIELEEGLIRLSSGHSGTPQIGRTHGQHAVPITLGFAFAEYVSRLGKSIAEIDRLSADLRGKISGAVGAYNALSLIYPDPERFERDCLAELGLAPSEHSTQLVEPEHLLRLLLEINTAFGILANCADDLRNLQRSEIAEVRESFSASQVGSSTMPQKRNPWNSEHVKSLWKAFSPRVMTFFMDQISEHQRDLTNSASSRFICEYLAGFSAAVNRMKKVITGIRADTDQLQKNLAYSGDYVLAEPLYILLALGGHPDAHEAVRKCTLRGEEEGRRLIEVLKDDADLWRLLETTMKERINADPECFFSHPESYSGKAQDVTRRIITAYSASLNNLKKELHR
jgi:adenylosuccinate lyase